MRQFNPPVYFLISIILIVILHFTVPFYQLLIFPWRLMGIIPLVIGMALNGVASHDFKKHKTTIKPFEKSTALVTKGVFNYTRNPFYLGMILIIFGIALLLGSITPFIIVPAFAILIERVFIVHEERMLIEIFGDQYSEYCDRVRRWI